MSSPRCAADRGWRCWAEPRAGRSYVAQPLPRTFLRADQPFLFCIQSDDSDGVENEYAPTIHGLRYSIEILTTIVRGLRGVLTSLSTRIGEPGQCASLMRK